MPAAPAPQPVSCPGNPDALGIARTVQIDTTELRVEEVVDAIERLVRERTAA